MEMRYPSHPEKVKSYSTDQLRDDFLIPTLFADDAVNMVYSHIDRIIVGGACPVRKTLEPIPRTLVPISSSSAARWESSTSVAPARSQSTGRNTR